MYLRQVRRYVDRQVWQAGVKSDKLQSSKVQNVVVALGGWWLGKSSSYPIEGFI